MTRRRAAINNGDDDVSRLGSSPAWAVLMVQVEHEFWQREAARCGTGQIPLFRGVES
jgi:hypothetical protein